MWRAPSALWSGLSSSCLRHRPRRDPGALPAEATRLHHAVATGDGGQPRARHGVWGTGDDDLPGRPLRSSRERLPVLRSCGQHCHLHPADLPAAASTTVELALEAPRWRTTGTLPLRARPRAAGNNRPPQCQARHLPPRASLPHSQAPICKASIPQHLTSAGDTLM